MAQRVHIVLEDDLDGSDADETVMFGLDGANYEIDLSTKNAAKLRDALASYVGVGSSRAPARTSRRRVEAARTGGRRRRTSASGPAATATRSPTVAGSRPTSGRLRRSQLRTVRPATRRRLAVAAGVHACGVTGEQSDCTAVGCDGCPSHRLAGTADG